MLLLLVQSKAADVRHDRWLVRSLPSRSSSREGGKVVELNLRRPRAADDEGGDADDEAGTPAPTPTTFPACHLRPAC
jgi:hypothetical protein